MLCGHCGATTSPELDRCAVCHTPRLRLSGAAAAAAANPPRPRPASTGELTRLSSGARPNAPTIGRLPAACRSSSPGHQFGRRYTIIRLLGSGGMAAVYQAWDETLGTAVALKLIRVDAGTPDVELRQLEDRFKRELKLARQVTHPNVVRIHDLGEVESTLYLTMEYVQGADLATLLQREPKLPLPRVLALARQIASGLAAAHRAGIVHRDLKPANVMVDAQEHALLMDFGIARSTSAATHAHRCPARSIGTLDYMAPEQARGEPADERTDVYAFGLILYELLAGGRPRYSAEGGLSSLHRAAGEGPAAAPDRAARRPAGARADRQQVPVAEPARRGIRPRTSCSPSSRRSTRKDARASPVRGRGRHGRASPPSCAIGSVADRRRPGGSPRGGRRRLPPAARAPLPVLIVDFENRAGEDVFDGALEQALSIAMEGAPFITAFPRRDAAALWCGISSSGRRLDESSGRLLSLSAGHSRHPRRRDRAERRRLQDRGTGDRPDKPEPMTVAEAHARPTRRRCSPRSARSRRTSARRSATRPRSAAPGPRRSRPTSLEAVRAYTIAQDLSSSQRDAEAVEQYREALRHDPEFGRAYSGLAASLLRLGSREGSARRTGTRRCAAPIA